MEPQAYVIIVPDAASPTGFRLAIGPFYGDRDEAHAYLTASRTEKQCTVLRLCRPVSPPDEDADLND